MDRDLKLKTQHSGTLVEIDVDTYYAKVKDIFKLNDYKAYEVKDIFTWGVCVNFSKIIHIGHHLHNDPFVFSCQGK